MPDAGRDAPHSKQGLRTIMSPPALGSWSLDSASLQLSLDPVEPSHHLGPVAPPCGPELPHHPRERLPGNVEVNNLCVSRLFRVAVQGQHNAIREHLAVAVVGFRVEQIQHALLAHSAPPIARTRFSTISSRAASRSCHACVYRPRRNSPITSSSSCSASVASTVRIVTAVIRHTPRTDTASRARSPWPRRAGSPGTRRSALPGARARCRRRGPRRRGTRGSRGRAAALPGPGRSLRRLPLRRLFEAVIVLSQAAPTEWSPKTRRAFVLAFCG